MSRTLTSPSNLHRRKACPGSARMEAQCAEGEDSEASAEGTLLHKYAANPEADRSELSEEQRDILERANKIHVAAIRGLNLPEEISVICSTEKRLDFLTDILEVELFSGTPDITMYFPDPKVLYIEDKKFGYNEVTPAESNLQLAAYGVMGFDAFSRVPEKIVVAINQPRLPFNERLTVGVYAGEQMFAVRAELIRIVEATEATDAPLNASQEACNYCRAKLICPAYKELFLKVAVKTPAEIIAEMPAEQLGMFADAVKLASGDFGKDVMAEVKRRVEAGTMPGWKLKPTGSLSVITDPMKAYGILNAHAGMTSKEFMSACKVSTKELADIVQKSKGCSLAKAKAEVKELLASVIEKKPKSDSVTREK